MLTDSKAGVDVDVGNPKLVAILLGSFNGEQFLSDQLTSFAGQSYPHWSLWVSDDGSIDKTQSIFDAFSKRHATHEMGWFEGPKKGFAANFLSLVCNMNIQADYFAYSDQDDIWESNKLSRAVNFLASIPHDKPALYCSRTEYVDQSNVSLGLSMPYQKPASFNNALVQNIASGNTMIFNQAARRLLVQAGPCVDIELHDWWTYLLITGAGGKVFFDQVPSVRYRQHSQNLWGMNTSFQAQVIRIRKLLAGRFQNWNERHIQGLNAVLQVLTPNNKNVFLLFQAARKKSLIPRLVGLKKAKIYRQTLMGNLGLVVAALLGRC